MVETPVSVLVRMPPRLKKKIAQDALRNESNLTQTIVAILAEHYGVKYTPGNKRATPFGGGRP